MTRSKQVTQGHCQCRHLEYEFEGAPKWVMHCHCESCRRQTASPFTTYAGYVRERVSFDGATLSRYRSSPGVTRSFCPHCGTPLAFEGARWPGEIHLFLAIFDTPNALTPRAHVNTIEQLDWIHLADGLPRLPRIGQSATP